MLRLRIHHFNGRLSVISKILGPVYEHASQSHQVKAYEGHASLVVTSSD